MTQPLSTETATTANSGVHPHDSHTVSLHAPKRLVIITRAAQCKTQSSCMISPSEAAPTANSTCYQRALPQTHLQNMHARCMLNQTPNVACQCHLSINACCSSTQAASQATGPHQITAHVQLAIDPFTHAHTALLHKASDAGPNPAKGQGACRSSRSLGAPINSSSRSQLTIASSARLRTPLIRARTYTYTPLPALHHTIPGSHPSASSRTHTPGVDTLLLPYYTTSEAGPSPAKGQGACRKINSAAAALAPPINCWS